MVHRYTRNQKAKELRITRFRRLRERLKPNDVKVAEQLLALHPGIIVNSLAYMRYLIIRAMLNTEMMEHYEIDTTIHDISRHPLLRKLDFQHISIRSKLMND
jgi:hypothetical protein